MARKKRGKRGERASGFLEAIVGELRGEESVSDDLVGAEAPDSVPPLDETGLPSFDSLEDFERLADSLDDEAESEDTVPELPLIEGLDDLEETRPYPDLIDDLHELDLGGLAVPLDKESTEKLKSIVDRLKKTRG